MRKDKSKPRIVARKASITDLERPFIEHVHELRSRLMFIGMSVLFWSIVAYAFERSIVAALLRPAHDQQFIYTSPGGGVTFLFRVCSYVGIAMSIPVIVYQVLRYVEPLIKKQSTRFILIGSSISGLLAIVGMVYGYFWGLPAALDFLLHQFVTTQIRPLVTIQSYMSFVTVYMLGSTLLLQIPLVLIFINRIKPLKPQTLFKYERHVIAVSFIIAGLMNPTPNVFALLFIAGPLIMAYQIGIAIVWYTNRHLSPTKHQPHVLQLLEHDFQVQKERLLLARQAQEVKFAGVAPPGFSGFSEGVAPQTSLQSTQSSDNYARTQRPMIRPQRRMVY